MNRDVIELVCKMNLKRMEDQLALRCAPVIVGLKAANLLIVRNGQLSGLQILFRDSSICFYKFADTLEKTYVLLYNRKKLAFSLSDKRVRTFLAGIGYQKFTLGSIFRVFAGRYQDYCMGKGEFPHELGLMLGYPLEDVEGFIRNHGKNYLYSGYWKVYYDLPAKKDLFRMYELARETLIELVSNGVGMAEIIDAYSPNTQSDQAFFA